MQAVSVLEEALRRKGVAWLSDFLAEKNLLDELEEQLQDQGVCPDCGGVVKPYESEMVCYKCGLVIEKIPSVNRLEFGTTYALEANLSFGKSLGGTLNKQSLMQVITRDTHDKNLGLPEEDINKIQWILDNTKGRHFTDEEAREVIKTYLHKIRLTHVKTHLRYVEPGPTMKLKKELSTLLNEYGLYRPQTYNETHHQIGNMVGSVAERVGGFLDISMTRPPESYRVLAVNILIYVLESVGMSATANDVRSREDVDEEETAILNCFHNCPLITRKTLWKE